MEPAPGGPGRRGRCMLLLLWALALALAGAATATATAWPHPHGGGAGLGAGAGAGAAATAAGAGRPGGAERWYRDLALRRMESVRSSFGARRDLATVRLSVFLRRTLFFPPAFASLFFLVTRVRFSCWLLFAPALFFFNKKIYLLFF